MAQRRPYRREAEDKRREALITAALDLIADGGAQAATVRAIADRAGVSPGLIRHYFDTKGALTREAYRTLMDRMTAATETALAAAPDDPHARLAVFVAASLRPPVADAVAVGLWAGFLHDVRRDPALRAVHATSYLGYRDALQALIADLPRDVGTDRLRADAISCNAVIDGLWLEGSMLPDSFGSGEIERIGLASVGALLGVDLMVLRGEVTR